MPRFLNFSLGVAKKRKSSRYRITASPCRQRGVRASAIAFVKICGADETLKGKSFELEMQNFLPHIHSIFPIFTANLRNFWDRGDIGICRYTSLKSINAMKHHSVKIESTKTIQYRTDLVQWL